MAGFQTVSTIISTGLEAPSGHSQNTSATALASVSLHEKQSFSIAASGTRAATAAAGFDAVIAAVTTAVQTWIDTTLGVDITAKDVDYIATVYAIALDSPYLNDASAAYSVSVDIQVRIY